MVSIGSTPVSIGQSAQLIQNLGPDDLYVGDLSTVTTEDGFRIATGESISVGFSNMARYAVSEGTSEIRTLGGGTGIFSAEAPAAQ